MLFPYLLPLYEHNNVHVGSMGNMDKLDFSIKMVFPFFVSYICPFLDRGEKVTLL